GFPVFAVSMGLYAGGKPLVAVVFNPYMDECYTAVTGQGAFLTRAGKKRKLQVSRADTLLESLLGTGFPYDRFNSQQDNAAEVAAFLKQAHGIRRAGAAALDIANVAAGRFDGYWEYKLHIWDVAAAVLLVQEAGGRVTFMDGRPYAPEARLNLVVSNGRVHQQMLNTLRELA
ncbi:MAG: inositol monophosphatase, partial [bacterium]|nr:inositol monophosphatase [bacterium]